MSAENAMVCVDTESLDELAYAQLPKVMQYCRSNGITKITKASPFWVGQADGNEVVIPPEVYKPSFPGHTTTSH
jgi:hypothetical protein